MKAAVVYTTLASAIILLFISQFTKSTNKYNAGRGLHRRLGYRAPPPFFDPLEEKWTRLSDEQSTPGVGVGVGVGGSPTKTEHEKLNSTEEHFFNEGRLNVTLRLMVLFPFLEKEPKDGKIDSRELKSWLTRQTIDQLNFRTQKELEFYDKDGDKAISFFEYLPQFSVADIERNNMEHGQAGWWKEQFDNADADQSQSLDFYEFRDFLHPEDSNNEIIKKWLLRKKLRQVDYNRDQKISFLEFRWGIYDSYKKYIEFETAGAAVDPPRDVFDVLDVNNNGFLDVEELKPLYRYLCPGELTHAKNYATFLIQEADENKDGKLTLNEMLDHDYLFYNTLYDDAKNEHHHEEL